MTKRGLVAIALSAALTAQCAGIRAVQGGPSIQGSPTIRGNAAVVLAAAAAIGPGTRVRLMLQDGRQIKAVLLGTDREEIVVRERTRLPEPPLRFAAADVLSIERETSGFGVAKMIALGAAIGTGVTLGFLAILAATLDD